MTELIQYKKFIDLSKKYEASKDVMRTMKQELHSLMDEIGVGKHFQDYEDGTVFQIIKPAGTFISFDSVAYERTKRDGEVKGSLSMKKAQELGYIFK